MQNENEKWASEPSLGQLAFIFSNFVIACLLKTGQGANLEPPHEFLQERGGGAHHPGLHLPQGE
jgi:hypothetical protein